MRIQHVVLAVVVAAGCRGHEAANTVELELVRAPHCAEGAALVHPIAVFAASGTMKHYSAHVGTTGSTRVTITEGEKEVVLKFGICPNPVAKTYACAPNNHDGVTYYAERKVVIGRALQAEFVEPTGVPNGMMCTDGKPATI